MPFSTYLPERMGSATLSPPGPFVAGSYAELTLVYTAGEFGIDDSGMLKVSWRTTSDMAKPQLADPAGPGYTTVEASNGASLECWFDRVNIRPWVNTLLVRVGRGFLRAGDTLTIRLGDRRQGSPGLRLQTNCEERFEAQGVRGCLCDLRVHRASRIPGFRARAWSGGPLEGNPALAGCRRRAVPPGRRRRGPLGQSDPYRSTDCLCTVAPGRKPPRRNCSNLGGRTAGHRRPRDLPSRRSGDSP